MKMLGYGDTVEIEGLRHPYQLVLDQKGYWASRGLLFTDEITEAEMHRGGRSVGFIAIVGVHEAIKHTLSFGELVQVSGVVYTVSAPGVGDGESANLVLANSCNQTVPIMKTQKAPR
ncbi:MAG: hypothetical protein ABI759_23245 [Candidatus Solibacter sp.]